MRGCKAEPINPIEINTWPEYVGGGYIERCPMALLRECPWWKDFVYAYNFLKAGYGLPVAGGMQDQAALFIQAVDFFDAELAQYDKKASDK